MHFGWFASCIAASAEGGECVEIQQNRGRHEPSFKNEGLDMIPGATGVSSGATVFVPGDQD
jgi:hypothetical protein